MSKFPGFLPAISLILLITSCGGDSSPQVPAAGNLHERIVNGVPIDEAAVPHIVRVLGANSLCTGTFLNPYQVLTAAHCVFNMPIEEFKVMHSGILSPAVAVDIHPFYPGPVASADLPDIVFGPGDLAIVTIQDPYTGPVAVLSSQQPFNGQVMAFAGYGQHAENDIGDGSLRVGWAAIDLVSLNDGLIYWYFNDYSESNTCYGDSGGPSFVRFSEDQPDLLVGVTSAGVPHCDPGSLSWNTLITHPIYFQWILEKTGGNVLVL